MKFPDITKSHTDSPDFKRDLKSLERETDNLFTHTQTILNILAEKASLIRRDIQLTKILVTEIQCMGITHIMQFDDESDKKGEEKLNEVRNVVESVTKWLVTCVTLFWFCTRKNLTSHVLVKI